MTLPTFTYSSFWDLCCSCFVNRGAGQPQGAVAVRPVLSAAGFPLQPGTLVAASAGIPGQCPASLAAVRGFAGTSAEITRRALVSRERAHQNKDM